MSVVMHILQVCMFRWMNILCVLLYLVVKQHEILQYVAHIRKSVVDKKYFTPLFCCLYAVVSFECMGNTWKTSGVD